MLNRVILLRAKFEYCTVKGEKTYDTTERMLLMIWRILVFRVLKLSYTLEFVLDVVTSMATEASLDVMRISSCGYKDTHQHSHDSNFSSASASLNKETDRLTHSPVHYILNPALHLSARMVDGEKSNRFLDGLGGPSRTRGNKAGGFGRDMCLFNRKQSQQSYGCVTFELFCASFFRGGMVVGEGEGRGGFYWRLEGSFGTPGPRNHSATTVSSDGF
ncbi:hypothetical protein RRG08_064144 [Elysia crispata]|uniref:Uncharacterized protein n=1 Tax=Elysia crispata TaxID=231223 RepID=A0AAE0ZN24_9GAST|nr:hypothetical protein RRG08_064144 [Elysia crispata]